MADLQKPKIKHLSRVVQNTFLLNGQIFTREFIQDCEDNTTEFNWWDGYCQESYNLVTDEEAQKLEALYLAFIFN